MSDLIGNQSNIEFILRLFVVITFQINFSNELLNSNKWSSFIYQNWLANKLINWYLMFNRNRIDLGSLFNEILAIRMNIGKINKSNSFALFVKFIHCGMNMSSLGCLIALIIQQESFDKLQIAGINIMYL